MADSAQSCSVLPGVGARSCRRPGDGALRVDADRPDNGNYNTLLVNLLQQGTPRVSDSAQRFGVLAGVGRRPGDAELRVDADCPDDGGCDTLLVDLLQQRLP